MRGDKISRFSVPLRIAAMATVVLVHAAVLHAGGQPEERPNFLVIVSDDQRPDTIGALGNSIIETPTLDSLVREGTAFTQAFAPNPICTPIRAEILTGCDGFKNGVRGMGGEAMDRELTLWPVRNPILEKKCNR